jgi:hypothetical protein
MLGGFFDKVTGLFDRRFTLALLLPAFAFAVGVGALTATLIGWTRTLAWWQHLDVARQVLAGVMAAAVIILAAIIIGTQVVTMTRLLEGYWRWGWADKTLGKWGRHREDSRRAKLAKDTSPLGYQRSYLAFAPAETGPSMPTRLGNALRAAETYPGDSERWGLDAAFWWPRLYLIMPDSARNQVDDARASLDQLVVLSMLSAAFSVVAIGFTIGGLAPEVGLSCAAGALLLSRMAYLTAVTSATVFGDLVRSCFDLFRDNLLARLGWQAPPALPDERKLWTALGQQLYRRGTSSDNQGLVNAPRLPPAPPEPGPG